MLPSYKNLSSLLRCANQLTNHIEIVCIFFTQLIKTNILRSPIPQTNLVISCLVMFASTLMYILISIFLNDYLQTINKDTKHPANI